MNRATEFMFFQGGALLGGGGRAATYDTDAQAIFTAMTTPPTTARKALINTLVLALKSAGVWSLIDVLYVLAAADNQAARLNWKSPATFNALAVNSPTFVADRGYSGDGSSSRLRTQFTPSTNGVNYTRDSASLWAWSLSSGTGTGNTIGSNSIAPTTTVLVRDASNNSGGRVNDATFSGGTVTDGLGFYGVQRRSSTDKRWFKNGVQSGSVSLASTGLPTQEQWICGSDATSFDTHQIAAAAWGASLSGLEASFYSALLPYMQALGDA